MEDTRLPLTAYVVRGPAEKRPIVQLCHGRVGNDAVATGGAEVAAGDVNGICRIVECPSEGAFHGVGIHGTAHLSVLITAHGVRGDLTRGTHGGVCRWERRGSA